MDSIAQQVGSFIYNKAIENILASKSPELWLKARRMLLRHCDPVVDMKFDGIKICIHLSHNLPLYYSLNPKYDRLLPKVCAYLREQENVVKLIDVGANIGDTVTFVDKETTAEALCIEGDDNYTALLQKNAAKLKNIRTTIATVFCTDKEADSSSYEIKRSGHGTSQLAQMEGENFVPLKTLDKLISDNPNFIDANMLKIDTDGFEAKTLIGGRSFISSAKPMIYFEFVPRQIAYRQIPEGISLEQLPDSEEEESFPILKKMGYNDALFFDNFGNYRGQTDTGDIPSIKEMIYKINMKDICYYDILTCHQDNEIHKRVLERIRAEESRQLHN